MRMYILTVISSAGSPTAVYHVVKVIIIISVLFALIQASIYYTVCIQHSYITVLTHIRVFLSQIVAFFRPPT